MIHNILIKKRSWKEFLFCYLSAVNGVEFSTFSQRRVAKVSQGLIPQPFLITMYNILKNLNYKYKGSGPAFPSVLDKI